jgi:hypothetical protein
MEQPSQFFFSGLAVAADGRSRDAAQLRSAGAIGFTADWTWLT